MSTASDFAGRSALDLLRLTSADVFKPEDVRTYERMRDTLWDGLVHYHNNVLLLWQIHDEYPGRLLGRHRTPLLLLIRNTVEHSAVIAHRLWNDTRPGVVTLRVLRNWVRRKALPEYLSALRARIDASHPDEGTKRAFERIENIRHQVYAHLAREPAGDLMIPGLDDLKRVSEFFLRAYNATGINSQASFAISGMQPQDNGRNDVIRTFDPIALTCYLSTSYEDEGSVDWRKYVRDAYAAEEISAMNVIRTRNGLPEMS